MVELHPNCKASFMSKIGALKNFGPLAILHLEGKLACAERVRSVRSKPYDLTHKRVA